MRFRDRTLWILAVAACCSLLAVSPASGQIVHLGNVIIDGSLCVGFDCVSGESFGFSTIVLKENNLRIMFRDTSVAASFPSNEWVLQANQSTNGGLNAFSIVDCGNTNTSNSGDCGQTGVFTVEAGAGNNAVYVDDGGRVGFGTSNPTIELHVVDGDSPALRLEQDGSSGFTPQTWDVAGNETNFFVRDVTMGSRLPLRIQPGASTNSIFINSTGSVGMGTSSPSEALHVARTDANATKVLVTNSNATAQQVAFALDNNAANAPDGWEFRVNAAGNFQITENGTGVQEFQINGVTGDVTINGSLSKGGGGFKIDHPLDPENRYLEHSFVESPEMLNIYRGRAVLDAEGRAVVTLPEWFEVLNRDYLYQLTPIGAAAPGLFVAREIVGGSFEIAGGEDGQVVSWQVTGTRADPFAETNRIQVETWKSADERGSYLHPAAYENVRQRTAGERHAAAPADPSPEARGPVAPR